MDSVPWVEALRRIPKKWSRLQRAWNRQIQKQAGISRHQRLNLRAGSMVLPPQSLDSQDSTLCSADRLRMKRYRNSLFPFAQKQGLN